MNASLKIILLACFVIFSCISMLAQTREPALSFKAKLEGTGEKKHWEIQATTLQPGSYSVLISLIDDRGMNITQKIVRVVKGSGVVYRSSNIDRQTRGDFRYRATYSQGYEPKKVDSTFIYRLPFSRYKPEATKAEYLYNFSQKHMNDSRSINWASLLFHLEKGDTVFAMRKGQVVSIEDGNDPREEGRVNYTSRRNGLSIEHEDGTISNYTVLEKGSFMVSEGDMVFPGTPLALCGNQSKNKTDYQLRVNVSYPVVNPEYDIKDSKKPGFLRVYYNPVFATEEGNRKLVHRQPYRATSSDELTQKEMTKREIKKYAKSK